MTDPRFTDPRLSDPVVRRDESAAGGMWGWIAGVAVLLLIGFLIIGRLEQQHQYSEQRLFDHNEQQRGAENDAARKHDGRWVVVNAAACAASSLGSVDAAEVAVG